MNFTICERKEYGMLSKSTGPPGVLTISDGKHQLKAPYVSDIVNDR